MTTAYTLEQPTALRPLQKMGHGKYRMTGTASSPEAKSLYADLRERLFGASQTPRGISAESTSVTLNAVQLVRISDDHLEVVGQNDNDSFTMPSTQPIFTVRATIKHAGKLKPRKFNFDE